MLEQKEKMRQRGMQNKQQRYYQGLELPPGAGIGQERGAHVVDLGSLKSEDRAEIRRADVGTMRDACSALNRLSSTLNV